MQLHRAHTEATAGAIDPGAVRKGRVPKIHTVGIENGTRRTAIQTLTFNDLHLAVKAANFDLTNLRTNNGNEIFVFQGEVLGALSYASAAVGQALARSYRHNTVRAEQTDRADVACRALHLPANFTMLHVAVAKNHVIPQVCGTLDTVAQALARFDANDPTKAP